MQGTKVLRPHPDSKIDENSCPLISSSCLTPSLTVRPPMDLAAYKETLEPLRMNMKAQTSSAVLIAT